MMSINISDVVRTTKGKLIRGDGGEIIDHVCIDSRLARPNSLFIALEGNNVDGHDYVKDALRRGAVAVLVEKEVEVETDKSVILVRDNVDALHQFTAYYRSLLDIPIIALTGSSGKTTTKDLISSVLSQKYMVHKTSGNQNNDLGVPLTVFGIGRETDMAVIEMGMNHAGEIRTLVNMVKPDIAIITNVGVTHIEYLKTQHNIFKAKAEILETLHKGQVALLNGDDTYLSTIKNREFEVVNFGTNENNHIFAKDIVSNQRGLNFTVFYAGKAEQYGFKYPGIHNVYNCLVAIYLGKRFDLSHGEIQRGLDEYMPSENRMDIKEIRGYKVINDCYNANPDSMKAALKVLSDYKSQRGRTFAVLGDMFEMGESADKYHWEVGKFAAQLKNIDFIIAVGEHAEYYKAGAVESNMNSSCIYHFRDNESAAAYLKETLKDEDVILIKGSRGMAMEEILHSLERS